MKFYKTKSIVLSVVTGIFLLGCGGGDDAPATGASSSTAFLSDSRLEGITYTCGSETGLTTAEGAFTYTNGSCTAVDFSIGGISLGSINVADINPDGIIYPADLLGLDRNNTSDPQLTNMLQLLQSLDNDGNPNNGINIDANTTDSLGTSTLSFENNTTLADVNTTLANIGSDLVQRDDAVAHYEDTLRTELNISVDTVPPAAAIITMMPSETYTDTTSITINGEVGAQVWVDGAYMGLTIDSNNSATFNVDTSNNTDINNTSVIILRDDTNASSDSVESSIFRASQTTLDLREVAAIKAGLEASTTPRAFTYTQMWNSGDDYNISFTPMPAATTETQEYNATATITKGLASDTLTISETVPFSQDLRDAAEVAAIKANLTARNFVYTQQWTTGDDYNVTFSEEMKAPATETQAYPVTANIVKGNISDTVTFTETVLYSQILRDLAEVAAIKANFVARDSVYTQLWPTGTSYVINFNEAKRAATTEDQSYDVTATISKGTATENVTFTETVPYSQVLRDIVEVDAAAVAFQSSNDPRTFSYANQWTSTAPVSVVFSESKRIATAIDQTYTVTITITIGTYSTTTTFTEFVPTTNVNITLGDGTTTLINDEYTDAFVVTNGGVFQKIDYENEFIGAAVSVDTSLLNTTIASSTDLLNFIVDNSSLSGLNSISSRNSLDGSLTARYEVVAQGENLYELLENLLASLGYSIDNIDFSLYTDVTNIFVDIYIEYDATNNSYVILSLTDKSIDFDSDIVKIINKDSVVQVNEIIVNEQESFTFNDAQPKGDFIFVIDDSGSMSSEQASVIDAIESYFSAEVLKYNLDWKATVIGTEDSYNYDSFTDNPTENNITGLSAQLDALTTNGGDEVGMKRVYGFLLDGSITQRANSSTTIIYASDEPEHSLLSEVGLTDSNLNNSYFVEHDIRYYAMLQEAYRNTDELSYNMATATGAETFDLYDYTNGYRSAVELAVRYAVAKNSSIKLSYPALASSITVHVDGVKTTAWEYDPAVEAIVFDSANIPVLGSEIIVTYSHLDFSAMVTNAKTEFDALSNDAKRAYTNSSVTLSFDPASPLAPLAGSDRTYDVNVTFSSFGYTETTTFQETVLSANYNITSNIDWLQTGSIFESLNHTNSTTSTLEVTMIADSSIDYVVSSEGGYDKLRVTVNGTEIGDYGNISGTFDVLQNDTVKLEYHKDGSSSSGTDNAIVTFH